MSNGGGVGLFKVNDASRNLASPSPTARHLDQLFDRAAAALHDDETNVGVIHSHSQGDGRGEHPGFPAQPRLETNLFLLVF